MVIQDQSEVLRFLSHPSTYLAPDSPVERIDTHGAAVFLTGERAYKLKKAVRYDFLDFSSEPLRRRACEAEVRVNRRTAPNLYLETQPITREAGGTLALGGHGLPVDWVVVMRRFPQEALLDRLAARNALELSVVATLAERIAQFHQTAEPRYDHGGHAGMRWVIDGNALAFAEHAGTLDPGMAARVTTLSREALARHGGVLDERQHLGRVRQCHGDLHLRNIVLIDDEPTLFDGVEFNDEIACVDVLYDLAFLLMDLLKRDLPVHANLLFNRYLDITHDLDGLSIVPLFLSCRAAIRAKISASAAALQPDVKSREAEELRGCAREYLAMAEGLIAPARPVFVAVGGLSGSGKSTLAARLAPQIGGAAPGAIVLRSDVIRKSLFDQRAEVRLGPEAYTGAVTDRVYGLMRDRASAALAAGYAAVADAVYTDPQKRAASAEVARRAGVPFIGLWLDVPAESLERRLAQRRGDASDATLDVLRQQLATEIGPLDWAHIDASREVVEIERIARDIVDDVEPR